MLDYTPILDYIQRNKEWIFSGVGISIIGAVFALGRHLLSRKRLNSVHDTSTVVQHAVDKTTRASPSLSVERIVEEIHAAPPYQKEAVAKSFNGIRVAWKGAIWDVENQLFGEPGRNEVEVQLRTGKSLHGILFTASVDKYPQLKILKRGEQIGVSGRIKAASGPGMYVRLDVDEISFPK
jgi:hypothetical protein